MMRAQAIGAALHVFKGESARCIGGYRGLAVLIRAVQHDRGVGNSRSGIVLGYAFDTAKRRLPRSRCGKAQKQTEDKNRKRLRADKPPRCQALFPSADLPGHLLLTIDNRRLVLFGTYRWSRN